MPGLISSTCDAWQASNEDAYLAVTAHWIEEVSPGVWKMQSALTGFTQMNNAHNGERLGLELYRTFQRLGIVHKVRMMACCLSRVTISLRSADWMGYM